MKTIRLFLAAAISMMSSALLPAQEVSLYQRGATYIESTMPPSPEPASVVRFADIPFTHSLGFAECDVPIYTLEGRELTIPIGLHYASGGIKIDEIAGVAGLGWTLHGGGCITRTVVDMPDEYLTAKIRHETPSGELLEDLAARENTTESMNYLRKILWHQIDSGLDRYSYNVCGLSGSFVIQDDGTVFQLSGDGVLIKYTKSATDDSINTFTITGPDGTVYTFSEKETAIHEGRGEEIFTPTTGAPDRWSATTAWYVSKIRSCSGLEEANFIYSAPVEWEKNSYVSYQTCSAEGPYAPGETPSFKRSSAYIACSYQTIYMTGISLSGTNVSFQYVFGNTSTKHRNQAITRYNCPARLSKITVDTNGNATELLKVDVGTFQSVNDGRIILESLRIYRGGTLDDKWDFEYEEKNSLVSYASQDWFGYYNGQYEEDDAGASTNSLCPYEMSAHTQNISLVRGYPNPQRARYMSLTSVNHDGAKRSFSYEGSTISDFTGTYTVGIRVKQIMTQVGLTAINLRYFTYENPVATGPVYPSENIYGTISGTLGNTGVRDACDWLFCLSDLPVAIGPSIRDTRIIYGKVTEDRADSLALVLGYFPPSKNTARTVYIYNNDCVVPNYIPTISRFPAENAKWYNNYGTSFINPWMGIREGYTCEEPTEEALLIRKEEYAYEGENYRLVSSSDYIYDDISSRTPIVVDYRATQVIDDIFYGNLNYYDIYHFPVYARSMMYRKPVTEIHVGYHSSGNDTTVINTTYVTREALSDPTRIDRQFTEENGVIRSKRNIYSDTWTPAQSWTNSLSGKHFLSVPLKVSYEIVDDGISYPVKEEVAEYAEVDVKGFSHILPSSHIEKTNGNESWRETILSRDHFGNISSFKEKGHPETVVLWGYGGRLPVAIIKNADIQTVCSFFDSESAMDLFAVAATPSQAYLDKLTGLRAEFPSAFITTYTHLPGIGVTSVTDEAGMTTTYEYDHAGRLVCVKDNDGNKVKEYSYSLMADSDGRRHMRSRTYCKADGSLFAEDVSWWDVFGRKSEDISISAAGVGKDLVTVYGCNFLFDDVVDTWLPYPADTQNGAFQIDAEQAAAQYHGSEAAYEHTEFEVSARNRVLSTALPGHVGTHVTCFKTDVATDFPRLKWVDGHIVEDGTWASSHIIVETTTDADGRSVSTFIDHAGRVLGTSKATSKPTYYVYDERDQLRAVVNSGISLTDTLSMWRYSYDGQGRLASKGVPNSVREFYAYDEEDRLVSILRNGSLKEMEYDAMGRVVKVFMTHPGSSKVTREEHIYDTYPTGVSGANPKGLVTKSRIAKLNPDGSQLGYAAITRSYNEKKNPVVINTNYEDGTRLIEEMDYAFSGEILKSRHLFYHSNGVDELQMNYGYNVRGRKAYEQANLRTATGHEHTVENLYMYDALGRPEKTTSSVSNGVIIESTSSYTLQGWQSWIQTKVNGAILFSQELKYDDAEMPSGMTPQHSGLISQIQERWYRTGAQTRSNTKSYAYDSFGYLRNEQTSYSNIIYAHDPRGNILLENGQDSRFTYSYRGDKLTYVATMVNNVNKTYILIYDTLGRIVNNGLAGHTITYNELDLVGNIRQGTTTLVNYFYLADGTKLAALNGSAEGLVYCGPFVYRRDSTGSLTLESAAFSEGRLTETGAMLHVTDYRGDVRAVVNDWTGGLFEVSDYSAYGKKTAVTVLPTIAAPAGVTLRDGFTGQESQHPDFGTHCTDFGARQYIPEMPRWMTPDPLSEKFYGTSPYAFCNGNPVNFVDQDGKRQWPVNRTYKGLERKIDDGFKTLNRSTHKGLDINYGEGNDDAGAPVFATHSGKVIRVASYEDGNAGGNRVRIQSEDGTVSTFYMHLQTIAVKLNDYVEEGTQIGTIGGSGKGQPNYYSAHLHYELIIDSQHVNPVIGEDNKVLIDPQQLNDPIKLGNLEPSVIVDQKKLLKLDTLRYKLLPVVNHLNIY